MKKLGILAADPYLSEPALWKGLDGLYEIVNYADCRSWDEATLLGKLREVDAVVTGRASPKIPLALRENFGRLKLLCHLHGTIRHLAEKPLIEAGLIVTNWGDAVSGVAEGAMALLLACLKQLRELDHFTRTHEDRRMWQAFPCTLKKANVGLYGFGPIGRHMARMLQAFEARVAIYDPFAKDLPTGIRRCETLRELFSTCSMISIHCGLNDATQGSVNRALLELLPQGAVIVNTARGAIIVEQDLADMLTAGRVVAGIDVIADERGGDAWQRTPLANCTNAILTRHGVAGGKGYPPGAAPKRELPDFAAHNLRAFARDEPLMNVITADVYDLKT